MFGGRFNTKSEADGTYFIDRDPEVFGIILNYLRCQPLKLQMLSPIQLETLREDAAYYQLPGLVDCLDELATPFDVTWRVEKFSKITDVDYRCNFVALNYEWYVQTNTEICINGIHFLFIFVV